MWLCIFERHVHAWVGGRHSLLYAWYMCMCVKCQGRKSCVRIFEKVCLSACACQFLCSIQGTLDIDSMSEGDVICKVCKRDMG